MNYEQIYQTIVDMIEMSEDKSQDSIDDIISDVISVYPNKEELFDMIIEDGAFGWLCDE